MWPARDRARRSGRLHNLARPVFAAVRDRTRWPTRWPNGIGTDPYADDPLGGDDAPGDPNLFGEADMADIRRDLEADAGGAGRSSTGCGRCSRPQQLLADLFADPDLIASAAPMLTDAERALLRRGRADAAGRRPTCRCSTRRPSCSARTSEARAARAWTRLRRQRIEYAQGALDIVEGSRSIDWEDEEAGDPHRHRRARRRPAGRAARAPSERLTAAQRAAADRRWAFGHVIVDEAQELSPMAWRLLMRRSPSRSMTVVGDVAQTGDLAGASSWDGVFAPYVADRWRLAELTVNYRTPAEIMAWPAAC